MDVSKISSHIVMDNIETKNYRDVDKPKEDNYGEDSLVKGESTNKELRPSNSRLKFSIHEKTKDIMVEIIDVNTNEVIREIPPKKIKDLIANILEGIGLLLDKRA